MKVESSEIQVTNIALLIQGPLHKNLIRNINTNINYFQQIIVSTWEYDKDDSLLTTIINELKEITKEHRNVKLIFSPIPKLEKHIYNPANFYFQVVSTLTGLSNVSTSHLVKCRSDEFFDLEQTAAEFRSYPQLPIFMNFIVREWDYIPFHISDHLFAIETNKGLLAFEELRSVLTRCGDEGWETEIASHKPPEVFITLAILKQIHGITETKQILQLSKKDSFQLFRESFRMINIERTRPYLVNANHAGVVNISNFPQIAHFSSSNNPLELRNFKSIEDLRPRSFIYRFLLGVAKKVVIPISATIKRFNKTL